MANSPTKSEKYSAAQSLIEFYIDLMENSKNVAKYYLSEDVVLDWFGQTIKGQKNVAAFLKSNVKDVRHLFKEAVPVSKIGFRDTHVVKASKPSRRILRSSFLSPPRLSLPNTPKKQPPRASTSANRQTDGKATNARKNLCQTDRNANCQKTVGDLSESPRKKAKLSGDRYDIDVLEAESDVCEAKVTYLSAEGHVEFHRPSLKKLQAETKWQRPCKLHIAYESVKDIKDSSFYLIIYEGNVKCKRNLMKDFEAEEPEN